MGEPTTGMQAYQDALVAPLFEPWAELLLDAVGLRQGDVVLDVACGPGTVTRIAARRAGSAGRVTGLDLSAAMLAIARAKPALVDAAPVVYVEGRADALGVADAAYDVGTCQQGIQFFPDREVALRELRRAL